MKKLLAHLPLTKAESARSKKEKLVRNITFFAVVICVAAGGYALVNAQVDVMEAEAQLAMAILQ
ncbi:hypothetical protein J5893_01975 [bacterium]|nr:hypothetical protein [bacterium]